MKAVEWMDKTIDGPFGVLLTYFCGYIASGDGAVSWLAVIAASLLIVGKAIR